MSDENVHADDDDNSFEQIEELEDKVLAITGKCLFLNKIILSFFFGIF